MTNLIIDLSNLFFRSLWSTGNYGASKYTFDKQLEIDQLVRKVSIDTSFIIRLVNPSRVIFALDSKSWRKNIEIEENDGYKANREKSGFLNWDNIYKTMKEFSEILDSNGFIVSKIENAEADDIICLWRDELLFKQNQHVIIASSDEDIRQLVACYPYEVGKKCFSVVINPLSSGKNSSKKLYIPDHFENWLNEEDESSIFDRSIDMDKEDFLRIRDKEKITFEYTDGNYIGMKKVLCGDDGDNVPSIYTWLGENQKVNRITKAKADKIINLTKSKDYHDLLENAKIINEQLISISEKTPTFKIEDRINRQIKLVILSQFVFPEQIVSDFKEHIKQQLEKPNIQPQSWNMNSILQGTRYVKEKGNEASIFNEIDKIYKLF